MIEMNHAEIAEKLKGIEDRALENESFIVHIRPSELRSLDQAATDERRIENRELVPVVHGYWIEDEDIQICSNCGEEHEWQDYRATYCDQCGALMDGKDDNHAAN